MSDRLKPYPNTDWSSFVENYTGIYQSRVDSLTTALDLNPNIVGIGKLTSTDTSGDRQFTRDFTAMQFLCDYHSSLPVYIAATYKQRGAPHIGLEHYVKTTLYQDLLEARYNKVATASEIDKTVQVWQSGALGVLHASAWTHRMYSSLYPRSDFQIFVSDALLDMHGVDLVLSDHTLHKSLAFQVKSSNKSDDPQYTYLDSTLATSHSPSENHKRAMLERTRTRLRQLKRKVPVVDAYGLAGPLRVHAAITLNGKAPGSQASETTREFMMSQVPILEKLDYDPHRSSEPDVPNTHTLLEGQVFSRIER